MKQPNHNSACTCEDCTSDLIARIDINLNQAAKSLDYLRALEAFNHMFDGRSAKARTTMETLSLKRLDELRMAGFKMQSMAEEIALYKRKDQRSNKVAA